MKRSPSSPKPPSSRKARPPKAKYLESLLVPALLVSTVQQWFPVLKPPPRLTVSQWADANRQLSAEASAEAGKWDTRRAEYQRGIMDSVSDPLIDHTVVMKSAQVGWTEIINNIVGYFIDQDPAPMLVLQPTLAMGEAWSKDRLAPMIRDTQCLTSRVADSKARDSGNTILHKKFAGGHLTIAGANSPASLASRPIRVVLADEIDRYPASAGAEGDPLSLAHKRANNFWNRRKLSGSTPTIAGVSRIEAAWELSDKRRFYVPCPHCGERQVLSWQQVWWPKGPEGEHLYKQAAYICSECGAHWDDAERWGAARHGEWRATAPFNGIAGFHIWEAYSPWVKLAETVKSFLDAKGHPETLKVWVNTVLGEPFVEKGEAPDWQRLYDRREPSIELGRPPPWVGLLTASFDVQRSGGGRLEGDIWGWGPNETPGGPPRRVLVEHIEIDGDAADEGTWARMDEQIAREWTSADGRRMRLGKVAIDTGDGVNTMHIYAWARRHPGLVMAIKGRQSVGAGTPVAGPVWVDVRGKSGRTIKKGVRLFTIGTSMLKSELYGFLRLEKPTDDQPYPPGYVYLPTGTTDEWVKQLVAEHLVRKRVRSGGVSLEWQKLRDRNEALDNAVYARAAAWLLGIDKWTEERWLELLAPTSAPEEHPVPQVQTATDTFATRQQDPEHQGGAWVDAAGDGDSWL